MRGYAFVTLCGAFALERVGELFWSRAHQRRWARRGGRVAREPRFAAMVALHAGTLVAAPLESLLRRRSAPPRSRLIALAALAAATGLRVWTLRSLGDAWSVRVLRFSRRRPVVTRGPYRYLRHPNYLAVIVELAALPLAGGAWVTAVAASLLNAAILSRRIPFEERELMRDRRYRRMLAPLPRLLPRLSWPSPRST
jgi:methyltransferase